MSGPESVTVVAIESVGAIGPVVAIGSIGSADATGGDRHGRESDSGWLGLGRLGVAGEDLERGVIEKRVDGPVYLCDSFVELAASVLAALAAGEGARLRGLGTLENHPDVSEPDLIWTLGKGITPARAGRSRNDSCLAQSREEFRHEGALKVAGISDVRGGNTAGPGTLPNLCEEADGGDGGFSLLSVHAMVIADHGILDSPSWVVSAMIQEVHTTRETTCRIKRFESSS